jgi:ABC-type Zn2+ transport system substrate-binding protein/surface adhesin
MRLKSTSLTLAAAVVLAALPLANAQNVTATTDPVGFITVNITAGTGSAKKISLISAPLLDVA